MSTETTLLTNNLVRNSLSEVMINRGYPQDLDAVTQPGIYSVGDSTLNGRPDYAYGTMTVNISGTFKSQVINATNGNQYQRVSRAGNPWGAWYVIQGIMV